MGRPKTTDVVAKMIAENELAGAQTPTPWSVTNAQYRSNVYEFLKALSALGATPLISIPNPPYTSGDALYWWQELSKVAILLRQVYFTAPNAVGLSKLGPEAASRSMRGSLRGLVSHLTRIGIPANRIALEMQFTNAPGLGQRAGLQPTSAWLEVVKLESLAAQSVANQFKLAGVWSWGWATFNVNATPDPDKAAAACVYLWARDPTLCDAPAVAGPDFDTSRSTGQVAVPAGARCSTTIGPIDRNAVARFSKLTGDAEYAASVLLEQLVLKSTQPVAWADVLSAERAVVTTIFDGSRSAYLAALGQAKITLPDARRIIEARLARDIVLTRFRPPNPSSADIGDFLETYRERRARLVRVSKNAPWLGGESSGWTVESLAPSELFSLTSSATIDTPDGAFAVTPLGPALPLGLLPPSEATVAARSALGMLARAASYRSWLHDNEVKALAGATCLNDATPTAEATDLTPFAPFLLAS